MLTLRRAEYLDAPFLWELANDPGVRWASGDRAIIAWETHLEWLTAQLANADSRLWVAERDEPVGYGRADLRNGKTWISVALVPAYRGQNLGRHVIRCVTEAAGRIWDAPCWARIRSGNRASMLAFRAEGYALQREDGQWQLLLHRPS